MRFTRIGTLFLALAVPCAAYAQQPKKPRPNSGTTAAPKPPPQRPPISAAPPPLTDEKAFFYFIAIYGAPHNAIERYGNYFDASNYRRAMADEFERHRYRERIGALIADGVKRINFSDKFTLVGSSTFEGYTKLGEYSFTSHSFPLLYVPYNSFCRNMDRSSGLCYGTFLNVGYNARVKDAVNGTDFNWSVPMSEGDANAFVKSRMMAQPGVVNRRVAARITYSILNKKGTSSGGSPIFIPFIYSVEVFGDESLTKKLGVIQKVNSLTPNTPEELRAAEERIREEEPQKLRDLLTTRPVLDGTLYGGQVLGYSGGEKIALRVMSFDSDSGSVSAEVDFITHGAPTGWEVTPPLANSARGHSSRAEGNVSGDTLSLRATWTVKDFFGKVTRRFINFRLRYNGLTRRLVGPWCYAGIGLGRTDDGTGECTGRDGTASFELK